MNFSVFEHFYHCPYCFAEVSIIIDPSVNHQEFIEDCEVCCNPIQFSAYINAGAIESFAALRMDD